MTNVVLPEFEDYQGEDDGDTPASSVAKALKLLDAFDAVGVSFGVSELARRTELPKSTAFRLLAILEGFGLVERNGTRYMLGKRLFELGNRVSFCRPSSLREVARPFLSDLYERTHETVHLAILEGTDVLYLDKICGHRKVRAPSAIGGRVPAYCCAIGKALLAVSDCVITEQVIHTGLFPITGYTISDPVLFEQDLETVRQQGVAFDREESSIGVNCIAAPVFGSSGLVVGAVSVAGQVGRFDPERHAALVAQRGTIHWGARPLLMLRARVLAGGTIHSRGLCRSCEHRSSIELQRQLPLALAGRWR